MKKKLLCPNEKLFSHNFRKKLKRKFITEFTNLSQTVFDKIVNNYEIVLLRHSLDINYKKNTKIKFIISPTTGENHIDKQFVKNKKIKIITLKGENNFLKKVNSTAEHTIYLILYLLRNNYSTDKKYFFNKKNVEITEINDKIIGIIGYGRLGRKVNKILKAFGANTLLYDIKNIKNKTNLNRLIKKSDIITLHIPLNEKNKNFFDNRKLLKLKNNSILINTSRGEIVDQKELLKIIKIKNIKYGTDVLHDENNLKSKKTNIKLLKLMKKTKNVYITPHIGGLSKESIKLTDEFIIKKFMKFV